MDVDKTPELNPRSSPIFLPSSPLALGSSPPNVLQGLVIPPFPKRETKKKISGRSSNNVMDTKEVEGIESQFFEQLDDFEEYVGYIYFFHR
jgi:hypothetical protein